VEFVNYGLPGVITRDNSANTDYCFRLALANLGRGVVGVFCFGKGKPAAQVKFRSPEREVMDLGYEGKKKKASLEKRRP